MQEITLQNQRLLILKKMHYKKSAYTK